MPLEGAFIAWDPDSVSISVYAEPEAGWQIRYDIAPAPPNRIVLVGVSLASSRAAPLRDREMTAERLRALRVGDYLPILEALIEHWQRHPGPGATKALRLLRARGFSFLLAGQRAMTRKATSPRQVTRRRGRPRLSDLLLAQTARAYLEAVGRQSSRPVVDAAIRLGLGRDGAAHVRDRINRARRRGLLTDTEPGQPGGVLIGRARALLRQATKGKR
jgi:hypothetical protein